MPHCKVLPPGQFNSMILMPFLIYCSYLNSDPLQFGFKKDSGFNHALFTFSESVKFYNKRGNKAYCVFLDASKAFDKVLINGLIAKLI